MTKNTIKITKAFCYYCWNFGQEFNAPINNIGIQEYRYSIFLLSLNNDFSSVKRNRETYLRAFSYTENEKLKYLMNSRDWKEFSPTLPKDIFYINGLSKELWDKERKKEIELAKKGKMGVHQVRAEYQEGAYFSLKKEIWEKVKITKSLNEIKLFHFILFHKSRGPYPVIKTDIWEIKTKCIMGNNTHLKEDITKYLNRFKEMKFIKDFKWDRQYLEIEK